MRTITVTGPGEVELNYMWLPTFIGIDAAAKKALEDHMRPLLEGKPLTAETLDDAHHAVLDFLDERYGIPGLRDYVDSMKFVETK